jgi:hypothetical protein
VHRGRCGDLPQGEFLVEDGPDRGKRQTEFPQGADQVDSGQPVDVVAPMTSNAATVAGTTL